MGVSYISPIIIITNYIIITKSLQLQLHQINNMNRCEHNEKITTFCASDCCVWKEAAGCEQCMRKYHNHMGTTIFLSEQDIHSLVKKYTMDNNIKPKCRMLQQAIYSYFNTVKTELTNSLDVTCKNIINQIGYPYLYSNNTLSTYKRLKNKQYKKLIQKQFKGLYELTLKINQKDLAKEESKIYVAEMKITQTLLNSLEEIVKSYQNTITHCHPNFSHDNTLINKITQIIKHMNTDSPSKHSHRVKDSEHPKTYPHPVKQTNQPKIQNKLKEEKESDKGNRTAVIGTASILGRPNYSRDVSIDRKLVKQPRFGAVLKKQKQKQKSEKEIPVVQRHDSQKIDAIRKQLNIKEVQISEKKKILIQMMKQKEENIRKSKEKQTYEQKIEDINQIYHKSSRPPLLSIPNRDRKEEEQQSKSMNDYKSEQSNENEDQDTVSNLERQNYYVQNHAFTKLPLEQSSNSTDQYFSQNEEIKQKVIVVPTSCIQPPQNQIQQIRSPLLKKKNNMSRYEEFKLKYYELEKDKINQLQQTIINNQAEKQTTQQEGSQLKENWEKSIALLIKSVNLGADQAIIYLQSALNYADNNLSAAEYLTFLYLQKDRALDCLHLCNKMLDKICIYGGEQTSPILYNNKAAALNILGRYSQSIVILQGCLRYRQKDYFYKNLGDAYFSISIYDKAIYSYQKCLKLNQNFDEAHYNLAVCLYVQQNYFNSKLSICKAIHIQPDNQEYLQLQANIQSKIVNF